MKRAPSLAVIDFADIPAGVEATDALLKKAPVSFFRSGTITRGRYLTLVGGTPASVEEALGAALASAGGHVLDHIFLADVHPRLLDVIEGREGRRGEGAAPLLVLETATVASVVLAAEKVLKGTGVDLVEVRLGDDGLSGKGLALFRGELHDLDEAVSLAREALPPAAGLSTRVLARPHEAFARQVALGTGFSSSPFVDLGGEEG